MNGINRDQTRRQRERRSRRGNSRPTWNSDALCRNGRETGGLCRIRRARLCPEYALVENFKSVSEGIKEVVVPEENVGPIPAAGLRGFLAKFTVLKGARRELWLTFLINLLMDRAYS